MNSKHRVHNFWSYFLTIQQPLETALREQDRHEYEHLLNDCLLYTSPSPRD